MEGVNVEIERKMSIADERVRPYRFLSGAAEERPLFFGSELQNEITGEELGRVTSVPIFRFGTPQIPLGTLQTLLSSYIISRMTPPTSLHPRKDLMDYFEGFRNEMTTRLETIDDRLSDIEKKIESTIPEIVVFEEMSMEEAKKRIFECLSEIDEKIYPSEIAERLHINYELCVEVIEELLKEGKIEIEGV
jgi:tetrahydromethanopterin S-methyltransferase subunit G